MTFLYVCTPFRLLSLPRQVFRIVYHSQGMEKEDMDRLELLPGEQCRLKYHRKQVCTLSFISLVTSHIELICDL